MSFLLKYSTALRYVGKTAMLLRQNDKVPSPNSILNIISLWDEEKLFSGRLFSKAFTCYSPHFVVCTFKHSQNVYYKIQAFIVRRSVAFSKSFDVVII